MSFPTRDEREVLRLRKLGASLLDRLEYVTNERDVAEKRLAALIRGRWGVVEIAGPPNQWEVWAPGRLDLWQGATPEAAIDAAIAATEGGKA
jgi:hypothetical protein